jgi:hypothetical protein
VDGDPEFSDKNVSVILRRFRHETIEIIQATNTASSTASRPIGRVSSYTEEEAQIFAVLLADDYRVRPVDWRRFAHDHAKVKELLSTCIHDNLKTLMFEPWSEDVKQRTETQITAALRDLTSIFDTKSVQCDFASAGRRVTVTGETINR